eukprot:763577-Hanusia_phi.AAC.1
MHVHTLESWESRADDPRERAKEITAVNVRYAHREDEGFTQEQKGWTIVPICVRLQKGWRSFPDEARWRWMERNSYPSAEMPLRAKTKHYYDGIRNVLHQTHTRYQQMYQESTSIEKTNWLIRCIDVEYEVVASERKLVKPIEWTDIRIDLKNVCVCCSQDDETKILDDALFSESKNENDAWKVLFFADSPESSKIEVEKERDEIVQEFINGATDESPLNRKLAKNVLFGYYFYKDLTDLKRIVHREKPVVLHLACHGSRLGGIRIGAKEMEKQQIVKAIRSMAEKNSRLRMVVLNFCWSGLIAKELREHVDITIGHEIAVRDEDALAFSKEFYYWLGANKSLKEAATNAREKCESCHLLMRTEELAGLEVWRTPGHRTENPDTETVQTCLDLTKFSRTGFNDYAEGNTAMLRLFQQKGFSERVAAIVCEELEIKNWPVNDLKYLKTAMLDKILKMRSLDEHQRERLVDVIKQFQAEIASHCSPSEDSSDSEADTILMESSDEEPEDDMESVVVRNAGDENAFKEHINGFIHDFCKDFDEYRDFVDDRLNEQDEVIRSPFVSRALQGEWTLCMLLWMEFAKRAQLRGTNERRWSECIKSATEPNLLEVFESCLRDETVYHPMWPRKKPDLEKLRCDKPYARAMYVTDCLVQQHFTARNKMMGKRWCEEVIHGWYTSEEEHTCMLLRANKFLRRQLDGISILTHVVRTSSYVCNLWMSSITAALLFSYLEARVAEEKALHGAGSDT